MRNETMITGLKTVIDAYYPGGLGILFAGVSSIITVSADQRRSRTYAAMPRRFRRSTCLSFVIEIDRELTSRFKRRFPGVKFSFMRDRCNTRGNDRKDSRMRRHRSKSIHRRTNIRQIKSERLRIYQECLDGASRQVDAQRETARVSSRESAILLNGGS